MTIFYHIGDLEFNASNPQDLKKELEEYFSWKGLLPEVELISDYVRVDIDDKKIASAEAKVKLAHDCCNRGNFLSAKKLLQEALEICPLYSDAYRTLAQIHMQEGREEEAVEACSEALKCDPKNMWALILMGNLELHFRKDMEKARTYYEKALEYYPYNTIALNNIAGAKLGIGDYDGALELFDRVLEKDSGYANAHYGKAACLEHLGRLEEAFEAARRGSVQGKETPENPGTMREVRKLLVSLARRIAQKGDYMEDALRIKAEVEAASGVPVELTPDEGLPVLAKMQYHLHHHADRDVVLYNPGKPFTGHYLIHEMMHLKMMTRNTGAGKGKVVYSDAGSEQRFLNRFSAILRPLKARLGEERFGQFWKSLFSGLGTRTMNSPLDLFVEDMIFEGYPGIRPVQLMSLLQQETDNMKADESVTGSKDIPKVIVDASRVMNLVQSLQLRDLYGIDMTPGHHPKRNDLALAEDLFKEYKAYKDTYQPGDEYELLEYFADNLRLQDLLLVRDEPPGRKAPGLDLDSLMEPTDEQKRLEDEFQAAHRDGEDPAQTLMMTMYMMGALEYMDGMPKSEVKKIAYDAAMLGVAGISPDRKGYFLPSVPGREFGGYEMLAWYYASWALSAPEMVDKLNLPFSHAWKQAVSMWDAKKKNGGGN